jgi:hypothetical protein
MRMIAVADRAPIIGKFFSVRAARFQAGLREVIDYSSVLIAGLLLSTYVAAWSWIWADGAQ